MEPVVNVEPVNRMAPAQENFIQSKLAINQARNWVNLRGGRRYICNTKDEIIHGLAPSVKLCCASIRDMFLAKV